MPEEPETRILITQKMINQIRAQQQKTGWSRIALFKYIQRKGLFEETKSFNGPSVNNWLSGKTKTILISDFEKIMEAYETLPPEMWHKAPALSRSIGRVPISDEFRARLNKTLNSTTMSRDKFLKYYGAPKELNTSKVGAIANGKTETIANTHLEFLEKMIAAYSSSK